MEFNPLDLLASAAELQERNKDETTTVSASQRMTGQQYNSGSVSLHKVPPDSTEKESKEAPPVSSCNKNNAITVVRKYKVTVNSDLEKMLDEHNYGNAKKSHKHEKSLPVVSGDSLLNREGTGSVSSEKQTSESGGTSSLEDMSPEAEPISGRQTGEGKSGGTDVGCGGDWVNNDYSSGGTSDRAEQVVEGDTGPLTDSRPGQHSDNARPVLDTSVQEINSPKGESSAAVDVMCKSLTENPGSGAHTTNAAPTADGTTGDDGEVRQSVVASCSDDCGDVDVEHVDNMDQSCVSDADGQSASMQPKSMVNVLPTSPCNRSDKPQVRVVSSRVLPVTKLEQPQTVIINISKSGSNTSVSRLSPTESAKQADTAVTQDMVGKSKAVESKADEQSAKNDQSRLLCTTTVSPLLTSEKLQVAKEALQSSVEISTVGKDDSSDISSEVRVHSKISDVADSMSASDSQKWVETDQSDSPVEIAVLAPSATEIEDSSDSKLDPVTGESITESPVTELVSERGDRAHMNSAETKEVSEDKTQFNVDCISGDSATSSSCVQDCSLVRAADKPSHEAATRDSGTMLETVSDSRGTSHEFSTDHSELIGTPCKGSTCERQDSPSDKTANDSHLPVFRFVSDHCYAGVPGKIHIRDRDSLEDGDNVFREETNTPSACSSGELSQDSGYGDITQSPDRDIPGSLAERDSLTLQQSEKTLASPVTNCLRVGDLLLVQNDSSVPKKSASPLLGMVSAISDSSKSIESNSLPTGSVQLSDKAITKKSTSSPAILTIGANTSPVLKEGRMVISSNSDGGLLGVLRPTTPETGTSLSPPSVTPSKVGKFRIGTFASFSNTGISLEENSVSPFKLRTSPVLQTPPLLRTSPGPSQSPVISPTLPLLLDSSGNVIRTMTVDQSPSSFQGDSMTMDHVHHDHDYCVKSMITLAVNSVLESRLQKELLSKTRAAGPKLKKLDLDLHKVTDSGKLPKRAKRVREDSMSSLDDLSFDESSYLPVASPSGFGSQRPKTRAEKYIEQKSIEPKVKITGSSNFQDQFVYFMNTKKRSRRRESRDSPLPLSTDKVLMPAPKPGDIVVPHLTDADIEVLKLRSRHPLKTETSLPKSASTPSFTASHESAADEESKIINTILSMENESLQSETSFSSDSMEMYGQSGDLMNLLPEQMNLTQEQIDLLYSAVEEVQNSTPVESDNPSFSELSPLLTTGEPQQSEAKPELVGDVMKPGSPQALPADLPDTAAAKSVDTGTSEMAQAGPAEPQHSPGLPGTASPVTDGQVKKTSLDETGEVPAATSSAAPKTEAITVPEVQYDANSNIETSEALGFKSDTLAQPHAVPASTEGMAAGSATESGPFIGNGGREASCSPVKSLLQSSSIGPQALTAHIAQDLALPPLDRSSLDILGNEFKLDKTDLFPEASVAASEPAASQPVSNAPGSVSGSGPADSAPWIVTVSMYWNDLPAVMINALPFVRLVDIHKQILPAKDTGILKKRCQLLGIEVGNCSEMQRYFLVQYGKAVNSKSTLIVSKDDAKSLIGYYVEPPPKYHRTTEEHKTLIELRREELRRIALAKKATRLGHGHTMEKADNTTSPSELTDFSHPILDDSSARSALDQKKTLVGPVPTASSTPSRPGTRLQEQTPRTSSRLEETPTAAAQGSRPQRSTRHKKINFLELLRGDSSSSLPDEGHSVDDEGNEARPNRVDRGKKRNRDSSGSSERAVKKTKTQKVGTETKLETKVVQFGVESEESLGSESEDSGDESSEFSVSADSEVTDSDSVHEAVLIKRPVKNHSFKIKKGSSKKVVKPAIEKVPSIKVRLKAVPCMPKPNNQSVARHTPVVDVQREAVPKQFPEEADSNLLLVIHKDVNARNGHRSRAQLGEVSVNRYDHKKSLCIRCYTCRKLLSVDNYLRHLHDVASNGRLVAVTQPQVIEPSEADMSDEQRKLWETFQRKKDLFDNNNLPSPEVVRENDIYTVENNRQLTNSFPVGDGKISNNNINNKTNALRPAVKITSGTIVHSRKAEKSVDVRVSSRKRKQKQLYPFETYTYSKKLPRLQIDSCGEDTDDGDLPPVGDRYVAMSSSFQQQQQQTVAASSVDTVGNFVAEKGSVVTLTNGPELTTFTALQDDLEV